MLGLQGFAPNSRRYALLEQAARSQLSKFASLTPRKPPLLGTQKSAPQPARAGLWGGNGLLRRCRNTQTNQCRSTPSIKEIFPLSVKGLSAK